MARTARARGMGERSECEFMNDWTPTVREHARPNMPERGDGGSSWLRDLLQASMIQYRYGRDQRGPGSEVALRGPFFSSTRLRDESLMNLQTSDFILQNSLRSL